MTQDTHGSDRQVQETLKTETGKVEETSDSFDRDLHGENRAGQHGGVHEARSYTAADAKELHDKLSDFDKSELKQIPVLAHGERLEQGATYLDISLDSRTPFVAQGSMVADEPHRYVPKSLVDYIIWNKLIGKDVS